MPRHWCASFDDMALDFDYLFEDLENLTNLEALSLDRILRQYGVHSVLDCACGTGIQSIGLARKGYRVFASDISFKMLEQLQEKARPEQLTIETKRADFRNLKPWKSAKFDAVICTGNSLTLVPRHEDILCALTSMIQVTRAPDGVLIVGLHNYLKLKQEGENLLVRRVAVGDGSAELILDLRRFEPEKVQITYMFIRLINERWHLKTHTKSYICLSADELRDAMLSAGCCSVRLLDISGQREFQGDEWVLAVGET